MGIKKQKGDLSRVERLEIGILRAKGYSVRAIARELERSPNTISYEIRRNSVAGVYQPCKAHHKARVRKRGRRLQWAKIETYPHVKAFVIEKLRARWNPDEIAGYLRRANDDRYISKTAIYAWLRSVRGERYCQFLYSKRKRAKRRKKKAKRIVIPNRVGIAERKRGADRRTRHRHLERDSIVGKKGTPGGIAVHQCRKSRLVVAKKVFSMRPQEHARVTMEVVQMLHALSVTSDNGIENRDHRAWGAPTFFCDPYASWQKGGVEHVNKMLRMFFPKGTDFSLVSQDTIDEACAIINNKPRKILGYRSALEVATNAGMLDE